MSVVDSSSSDFSDADPQALLDSMKDLDELDAGLFGGAKPKPDETKKNKPETTKKSSFGDRKKVSFHKDIEIKEDKEDDLDFDLDDPLKDLVLDDDDLLKEPVAKKKQEVSPKKQIKRQTPVDKPKAVALKPDPEDSLFADDDNNLFDALGLDDNDEADNLTNKNTPKDSDKDTSFRLDNLLSTKPAPKQAAPARKTLFDKDGNFIKDSFQAKATPKTPESKDVSFGGYQPSGVTTPSGRRGRSAPEPVKKDQDRFFDFLTDLDSKPAKSEDTKPSSVPSIVPSSAPPSGERSKSMDFLGLGDEVDLDSVLSDGKSYRPISAPSARRTRRDVTKDDDSSVASYEDPLGKPPRVRSSPLVAPSSPLATPSSPIATVPSQINKRPPLNDVTSTPDVFHDVIAPSSNQAPPRVAKRRPANVDSNPGTPVITSSVVMSPAPSFVRQPVKSLRTIELPSAVAPQTPGVAPDARTQALEVQIEHMRALLHETQLGFQADLELVQQTYDGRVQLLQRSLSEVVIRSDREMSSVRESYSARLDALRDQARDHAREEAGREIVEQEEIKRLRQFHLEALEETRLDYEQQLDRMRRTHQQEIETIKSSSVITRNVSDTLDKANSATQLLQELAVKYDSAFQVLTHQSESMMAANNRIHATLTSQMQSSQRENNQFHSTLQQTASKLEGTIIEMNRRFEEQHFQMQSEQARLLAAQSSLETEKRQMIQQVSAEREQARKAMVEALELQQTFQREARDERDRLARKEEEVRIAARSLEERRTSEAEKCDRREMEARNAAEELARERAAIAVRSERLAGTEARVSGEKLDFDRRSAALKEQERGVEEKREDLARMEKEVRGLQEKHAAQMAESSQALQEAKRVEHGHRSRLNEIHAQSEELARQRQLLAEERKAIAEERLDSHRQLPPRPANTSPMTSLTRQHPGYDVTPVKLHRSDLGPVVPHSASSVLWEHSAEKDRDYLENQEIFLETLKKTSYHGVTT